MFTEQAGGKAQYTTPNAFCIQPDAHTPTFGPVILGAANEWKKMPKLFNI